MITFKLNEIPDGKSSRNIHVLPEDLDLSGLDVKNIMLHINFIKSEVRLKPELSSAGCKQYVFTHAGVL